MKESTFIRRNQKDWKEYEAYLKGDRKLNPRESVRLYLKITSDLSQARTFYPKSRVTSYLNKIAHRAHRELYKFRRFDSRTLKDFITIRIPQALHQCRASILWSLAIFSTFMIVGFLSGMYDDTYVRLILGDDYVNMTMTNIEKEDPLGVYGNMESLSMFTMIGLNNIMVSFKVYVYGILGGLGTVYGLMQNGVMVGAFFQMFQAEQLLLLAVTTIMIHGTLELFAIVVAGGAGLELGRALLFPGTYPRLFALRMAGKRSLYVILGLIPVFILASLLESFFTRHYIELGLFFRSLIILISLVLIYWYFFYYPNKIAHERGD